MKAVLLGLSLVIASGCAHQLDARFLRGERVEATAYPKAPAVVLRDGYELAMDDDGNSSHTHIRRRRSTQILRPRGLNVANVKLDIGSTAELVAFKARTIDPDGTIVVLTAEQVFITKSHQDGEVIGQTLRFTFPQARVGSIVEYSVVTKLPYLSTEYARSVQQQLPVLSAQVRVSGTPRIHPEVHVYNHQAKPTGGMEDGRWWIALHFEDVPAESSERMQPHWTWRAPYWIYRMTHRVWRQPPSPVLADWNTAGRWLSRRIWNDWGPRTGAPPDADRCAPKDVLCRIRIGWDDVQRIESSGRGSLRDSTTLAQGQKTRKLPAAQRSALLWRTLSALDVEAFPAAIGAGPRLDWTYPLPMWLKHLLVFVPAQGDLTEPLWLDPECWWCTPGELPHWSAGAQAVILDYSPVADRLETSRRTAQGEPPIETQRHETLKASLTAQGDLRGDWTAVHIGHAAMFARNRGKDGLQAFARRFGREAKAEHIKHGCALEEGRCYVQRTVDASDFAAKSGKRLVLPLTAFHQPGWLDNLAAAERRTSFQISGPIRRYIQRLEFVLPSGMVLQSAPTPFQAKSALGEVHFKVEAVANRVQIERTLFLKPGLHLPEQWRQLSAPLNLYRRIRDAAIIIGPASEPAPAQPANPAATLGAAPQTVPVPVPR